MQLLKATFLVILIFIFTSCYSQLSDNNYRIFSVKLEKEVTISEVILAMKDYDVLFFGEEHNDSVTHFLENKMLELLYQQYSNKLSISMEMFDRDVQPVMNEYLTSDIREKNFKKDARVWSNYKDYRPMIEFAKKNQLHVICANAAGRYSNLAGRKGLSALEKLPKESKVFFAPLPYDTASGAYYQKLKGLSNHTPISDTSKKTVAPAMMGMGNFNLILAQSLWDATMAYSISEYMKRHKGFKIMQINGRFHSDEGFGTVTQLKKYSPKLKSLIISTASDDAFPTIDWNKYKNEGDYIIITDPLIPRTYEQ